MVRLQRMTKVAEKHREVSRVEGTLLAYSYIYCTKRDHNVGNDVAAIELSVMQIIIKI